MTNPGDFEAVSLHEAPPPYLASPPPGTNPVTVGYPSTHRGRAEPETVLVTQTDDALATIFGQNERFFLPQTKCG